MTQPNEESLAKVEHVLEWTRRRAIELRQLRGYTQRSVGDKMGYTGRTETRVSDFERGSHRNTIGTLFRLCRALNITMAEFFRDCPGWGARRVKEEKIIITTQQKLEEVLSEHLTPAKVRDVVASLDPDFVMD